MQFILVRHGESVQNIGNALGIIDQKVELSEKGIAQTERAVNTIKKFLDNTPHDSVTVLYSPYVRTMEMATRLQNSGLKAEYVEEPLVSEIQCGDFEGYTPELYKEYDPDEYEKMRKYKEGGARFWYRYRNGESPFDVNVRANLLMMKLKDCKSDIVIVISHLFFLKTLEMNLLKRDLIWMEQVKSFKNAEIHIINNNGIVANIEP